MNKVIAYLMIAIAFSSAALGLGIGARNVEIPLQGEQSTELFIINDEQKSMVVKIGILGEDQGVRISPYKLHFSPDDSIKSFTAYLDFDRIKELPVKLVASEISQSASQFSAQTNIVYTLPIARVQESGNEEIPEKERKMDTTADESAIAGENKKEDIIGVNAVEEEKNATTRTSAKISGAITREKALKAEPVTFEIMENEKKLLIFVGLCIITLIFLFDLAIMKRKAPIEKYIIKTRKLGMHDQEIKSKLENAGWDGKIVNSYLKK